MEVYLGKNLLHNGYNLLSLSTFILRQHLSHWRQCLHFGYTSWPASSCDLLVSIPLELQVLSYLHFTWVLEIWTQVLLLAQWAHYKLSLWGLSSRWKPGIKEQRQNGFSPAGQHVLVSPLCYSVTSHSFRLPGFTLRFLWTLHHIKTENWRPSREEYSTMVDLSHVIPVFQSFKCDFIFLTRDWKTLSPSWAASLFS